MSTTFFDFFENHASIALKYLKEVRKRLQDVVQFLNAFVQLFDINAADILQSGLRFAENRIESRGRVLDLLNRFRSGVRERLHGIAEQFKVDLLQIFRNEVDIRPRLLHGSSKIVDVPCDRSPWP